MKSEVKKRSLKVQSRMPSSQEAEDSVLGCILSSPCETLPIALDRIGNELPDAFYDQRNRLVIETILGMWSERKPIDLLTLREKLKENDSLEMVGGYARLSACVDGIHSTANAPYWIDIISEKHTLRKLIAVCNDTLLRVDANAGASGSADVLLGDVERNILGIRQRSKLGPRVKTNSQAIEALMEKYDEAMTKKSTTGITTGIEPLDEIVGGLSSGDYAVIGAATSVGKTSFCLNVASHVFIDLGLPVVFFSLEMTKEEIIHQMACTIANVDGTRLKNGSATSEEIAAMGKAFGLLNNQELIIDDTAPMTLPMLEAKARRYKQEFDGVAIFFVDYFQLLRSGAKTNGSVEDMTITSNGIKLLAKELGRPFMVSSQFSREPGKDGRAPVLSDLRGCGAIEQDADVVILLNPVQKKIPNEIPKVDAFVAKRRGGKTGKTRLVFYPEVTKFCAQEKIGGNYDQNEE